MDAIEIQEALDATNLRSSDLLRAERLIAKWKTRTNWPTSAKARVKLSEEIQAREDHLEAMRPLVARRQEALKALRLEAVKSAKALRARA